MTSRAASLLPACFLIMLSGCDLDGMIEDQIEGEIEDIVDDADISLPDTGACGSARWYADADGDGIGDPDQIAEGCEPPGADWVDVPGDCDDRAPDVHPGAAERCDGVDTDCDPQTGEGGLASRLSGGAYEDITDTLTAAGEKAVRDSDVVLCAGTWTGPFRLIGQSSLVGVGGEVIIDADGGAVAVVIQDDADAWLSDVTITGADGGEDELGGGIRCHGSARLSLTGARVTGNHAGNGGGIGSMSCDVLASATEIVGNTADYGAGVLALGGSVRLYDSVVEDNRAAVSGGALYAEGARAPLSVEVVRTSLSTNTATYAGALYLSADTTADLVSMPVRDNVADVAAGVLLYDLGEGASCDPVRRRLRGQRHRGRLGRRRLLVRRPGRALRRRLRRPGLRQPLSGRRPM